MSSEKTTNLQLNKWVPTDYVKMDEFNENFDTIDDKIGILNKLVVSIDSFPIQIPETDDTARINRAIQYVKNAGGGAVTFPLATYNISGNPAITLENAVSLIGAKQRNGNNVIFNYKGTGSAIRCYKDSGNTYLDGFADIILEGITLKDIDGTGDKGLDLNGFRTCEVRNFRVIGFNTGIFLYQSWYAKLTNIICKDFRQYGLLINSQSNNITVDKVWASSTVTSILNNIYVYGSSSVILNNISIEGEFKGIKISNCNGVKIDTIYAEYSPTASSTTSYAIGNVETKGLVILSPYIHGNGKVDNGVTGTSSADYLTTIIGGRIWGCTEPYSGAENMSAINVDTDRPDTLFGGQLRVGSRRIQFTNPAGAGYQPPTTGIYRQGDIYHIASSKVRNGVPAYYQCIAGDGTDAGTWAPVGQVGYRTTNESPQGNLTPNFIGERVLDTTNKVWYFSTGITSNDWQPLMVNTLIQPDFNFGNGVPYFKCIKGLSSGGSSITTTLVKIQTASGTGYTVMGTIKFTPHNNNEMVWDVNIDMTARTISANLRSGGGTLSGVSFALGSDANGKTPLTITIPPYATGLVEVTLAGRYNLLYKV